MSAKIKGYFCGVILFVYEKTMLGMMIAAAGSLYGGYQSAKANEKARDMLRQMDAENKAWYERNYNEDATRRADAQHLIQMTEDSIKRRNRQAAGTAAVMGGSTESVAAQQAANGEAMANVMGQVAAAGAERKDQVERQYMQTRQGIQSSAIDMEKQRAQQVADATKGVLSAAGEVEDPSWLTSWLAGGKGSKSTKTGMGG